MASKRIQDARNFREADATLATCGQPTEEQLAAANSVGFEVVINLALHDDPRYSLQDERATVEGLGMTYVYIPVLFSAPTETDLLAFFDAMDASQGRHVLVHCAANYRVTAFLGLYRLLRQRWTSDRAFELMGTVWTPDQVWAHFIESMIAKHGGVDASTVRELVVQLEEGGIPVWLDGGWGIDALLGRDTRPHHDLDIVVRVVDVPKALEVLQREGFGIRTGSIPDAFVLVGPSGHEVDVHTVTFHSDGTAVHRMDDGNDWVFSVDAFMGEGTVDGAHVRCLSAETQVQCHAQGYVPTEKDFSDMELLQQAFGLELPPSLRRPT